VLRRALLAMLLVSAITPVLCAKEQILVHRIGPSQSTLFIASADGSGERPLLPNSGFEYNASFSADGKWIIFTSERGGSADIYRVHPDGSGLERLTDDPAYDDQAALSPEENSLRSSPHAARGLLTFGCSTCTPKRRETSRTPPAVSGRPGPQTGGGSCSHRTGTRRCDSLTLNGLRRYMLSAFM